VIDNCEHVVRNAADLVAAIVAGCPSCSVVAASREHMGLPGERIVRVDALEVGAAVQLFLDRARRLGVEPPAEAWAEPLAGLCRALDNLPLAIELAASRATVLTPPEILAELDERFEILRDPATAPRPDRRRR
jgi:predicted ATPase